jgi:hypothetical protein
MNFIMTVQMTEADGFLQILRASYKTKISYDSMWIDSTSCGGTPTFRDECGKRDSEVGDVYYLYSTSTVPVQSTP